MAYLDERKFLHDISNPLAVVHGNLRITLRKMEQAQEANPQLSEFIEKLNKAMDACERINKAISVRRDEILRSQDQDAS